jgi:hypothetical protein
MEELAIRPLTQARLSPGVQAWRWIGMNVAMIPRATKSLLDFGKFSKYPACGFLDVRNKGGTIPLSFGKWADSQDLFYCLGWHDFGFRK